MSLHKPATARLRIVRSASMLMLTGALVIAGCGGSSKSSSTGSTSSSSSTSAVSPAPAGGHTLSLTANPEGMLKFDKTSLTAKAGSVSIAFTNMSPLSHNVTVATAAGSVVGATATFTGGTKLLPLNLKPGTYKFFCTVPGHRAAGMEGTLTVQ